MKTVNPFIRLLLFISLKYIHRLLYICMIAYWELFRNICIQDTDHSTSQWDSNNDAGIWKVTNGFRRHLWMLLESYEESPFNWPDKRTLDLIHSKRHGFLWEVGTRLGVNFNENILMKLRKGETQRASPVSWLGWWSWREMTAWRWGRCGADLQGPCCRRGYTGGRVSHVGTVGRGHQLRGWAAEVLDRGRSIDPCGLTEPRGLSPRIGPWGLQVI